MKNSNKLQRVIQLNKTTVSMLSSGGGMGGNTIVNQEVSTGNGNFNQGNQVKAGKMAGGGDGGGNVVDGCGGGGGNHSNLCTNSCDNIATCWTCEDPYYDPVHNLNYPGTCTCPGATGNTDTRIETGTGITCGCTEVSVGVTCNIQNCQAPPHEVGEQEGWIDQISDLTEDICHDIWTTLPVNTLGVCDIHTHQCDETHKVTCVRC